MTDAISKDIARLVAQGMSAQRIATALGISRYAVKTHRRNIGLAPAVKRADLWTHKEIQSLKSLFAQGFGDREIAARLGRTVTGVEAKRWGLGLLHIHRRGQKVMQWTAQEIAQLRYLNSIGKSDGQIAEALGRTRYTVKHKREYLGLGIAYAHQVAGRMTPKNSVAKSADLRVICREHLIDLMRAMNADSPRTTLGEAKAEYQRRHELTVPDSSTPVSREVSRFVGSACSSAVGWLV